MADAKVLAEILKVLRRIDARLAAVMEADGIEAPEPTCPHCGSTDLLPDAAFGEAARVVCRSCSRVSAQEAVNG